MQGWVIDRDYLAEEGDVSRVGTGQVDRETVEAEAEMIFGRRITIETDLSVGELENPVRFRLRDEDGEIHFGGAISLEWLNGDETLAFAPLNLGETDTGATILAHRPTTDRERERADADGWVML